MMKQFVYPDQTELSIQTAKLIAGELERKPGSMLCFPAGETSLGTFRELVRMHQSKQINFDQCRIVGLDEWLHLGEKSGENCFHFLDKHLFGPLSLKKKNFCFFDGETADPEAECRKTDHFIKENGGIDLMLLGLGMNGHLGLNEPGTSADLCSHIVELDEVTRTIGQKYFTAHTNLTQGITLGMKQILEARTVLLQVSGLKKKPLVKRLLENESNTEFPASLLHLHPDAFLLIDKDANPENF
ncbi:MAG: glucosamine-6-phosphate deaminase [Bacteroidetes bacterium]|nr:glucosamine-6-phosphate deaminase [Bacteroidota bacterium]